MLVSFPVQPRGSTMLQHCGTRTSRTRADNGSQHHDANLCASSHKTNKTKQKSTYAIRLLGHFYDLVCPCLRSLQGWAPDGLLMRAHILKSVLNFCQSCYPIEYQSEKCIPLGEVHPPWLFCWTICCLVSASIGNEKQLQEGWECIWDLRHRESGECVADKLTHKHTHLEDFWQCLCTVPLESHLSAKIRNSVSMLRACKITHWVGD